MSTLNILEQTQEKDQMDIENARLQNSLVPAVNLPFELLSYIFELVIDRPWWEPESEITSPLSLGTICNKWRDVTLASPHLWSKIDVILDGMDGMDGTSTSLKAGRVQLWLKRAADCPLSVTIVEADSINPEWDPRVWTEAVSVSLKALFDRAEFWKSIDICLSTLIPEEIVKKNQHTFGMLSTVKLSAIGLTFPLTSSPDLWNMFATAPLLRHVTLDHQYLIGPTPLHGQAKFPLHQLESISGCFERFEQPVEMLRLYPNLRHLKFDARFCQPQRETLVIQPLHNDTLQTLTLYTPSLTGKEINQLLDALTLPSLHKFSFSSDALIPTLHIHPFLSRSSCDLLSLHLAYDVSEEEVLQCLKLLPSLVTLQIENYSNRDPGLTEVFIDSLHPSSNKRNPNFPCLVPKLQHLTYMGRISFSDASFADLMACRWRGASIPDSDDTVAQLRSVHVTTNSNFLPDYHSAVGTVLKDLELEGMHFKFTPDQYRYRFF